jgi:hypothetical protein
MRQEIKFTNTLVVYREGKATTAGMTVRENIVAVGSPPHHDQIEVLLFTITHNFLELLCLGRILGIVRQISRADKQTSFFLSFIIIC